MNRQLPAMSKQSTITALFLMSTCLAAIAGLLFPLQDLRISLQVSP